MIELVIELGLRRVLEVVWLISLNNQVFMLFPCVFEIDVSLSSVVSSNNQVNYLVLDFAVTESTRQISGRFDGFVAPGQLNGLWSFIVLHE